MNCFLNSFLNSILKIQYAKISIIYAINKMKDKYIESQIDWNIIR